MRRGVEGIPDGKLFYTSIISGPDSGKSGRLPNVPGGEVLGSWFSNS